MMENDKKKQSNRINVSFQSHGLTCRGWLYRPAGITGKIPAIVMSHGYSAVKEQGLQGFAEVFCESGFAVLVFDYRCLGESEGNPRGRIVPQEQHDDIRAALEWIAGLEGIDKTRIGLWGTSYAGGHALYVGALDPHVKAVVAQLPGLVNLASSMIELYGREYFAGFLEFLAQDLAQRNTGGPGGEVPIVAPVGEISMLPTEDSYEWFTQSAKQATGWVNRTQVESVARGLEYFPAAFIQLISPKPLLIIAATGDQLIPIVKVREAFAQAGEPKKLVELDCGHFELYPGERCHHQAAAEATRWFKKHL